jgi:alpha-D-xyloside xylohydrolase
MEDFGMARLWMTCAALALGIAFCSNGAAQDVTNESLPGATHVQRAPEVSVPGLTRRDANSVAFALGARPAPPSGERVTELLVHDFSFNGDPVTTDKIHLRQVSPGVVEITSVAWEVGYWRFRVRDAASYYGLGERFDVLDHAHTIVKNLSMDTGGVKGTSTYKPMPFFMSTSGYGLWLDTTGEATFDMNASDREELTIDATTSRLHIVLFTGPEFPVILEHFTALTQRAIVPPYWAFAPWKSRDYHRNDAEVKEDVDKNRELGLPASVIMIDSPWTAGYNDYKFNPLQFTDAPGMVKYIHQQGYKLVLWHTPWINSNTNSPGEQGFAGKIVPRSSNYQFPAEQGLFVKNPDGSPYVGRWWKGVGSLIDFTNPKAKQWWQDQVRQAIQAGADGFKDDDAEGNFIGDAKFADGTDPRVMRNRYAVLYNNAMEELIQKDLKGNGVLFARSVTAGANGIGLLWGGDNEASFSPLNGLPSVVTAGLGAGLSGEPLWTADLGGYEGLPDTPNARLLERWTEYAAFSPVMEVMSSKNISPWNFDRNGPPGSHEALDIYKKYAVLHMSLFPYRYAAAQQSAKTGMPIMRALVLNYQDDSHARTAKDEYLFGPDFLVAPIVDEGVQRAVYLPPGEWIDYWTGTSQSGARVVAADAPIDRIPLWARAGAVLPKIPEDVMTLVPPAESGNSSIKSLDNRRVYEVIGGAADSPDTTITDFEGRTVARRAHSLKIDGGAARVTVRWRFGNVGSATVNGTPATLQAGTEGPSIEFDHGSASLVEWQEGAPPASVVEPVPAPEAEPSAAAPVRSGRRTARGAVKPVSPAAAPAATITAATPERPAASTAKPTPAAKKKATTHHRRRSRRKKH